MKKDIDNSPVSDKMNAGRFEQFRCSKCGRMLAQVDIADGSIRIKCYNCNTFNDKENLLKNKSKNKAL